MEYFWALLKTLVFFAIYWIIVIAVIIFAIFASPYLEWLFSTTPWETIGKVLGQAVLLLLIFGGFFIVFIDNLDKEKQKKAEKIT